jgi:hypothetical protein
MGGSEPIQKDGRDIGSKTTCKSSAICAGGRTGGTEHRVKREGVLGGLEEARWDIRKKNRRKGR